MAVGTAATSCYGLSITRRGSEDGGKLQEKPGRWAVLLLTLIERPSSSRPSI